MELILSMNSLILKEKQSKIFSKTAKFLGKNFNLNKKFIELLIMIYFDL